MKYRSVHPDTAYSLFIVLPNKRTGLSALESSLKNYDFKQIINNLELKLVDVTIPNSKSNLNWI